MLKSLSVQPHHATHQTFCILQKLFRTMTRSPKPSTSGLPALWFVVRSVLKYIHIAARGGLFTETVTPRFGAHTEGTPSYGAHIPLRTGLPTSSTTESTTALQRGTLYATTGPTTPSPTRTALRLTIESVTEDERIWWLERC